MKYSFIDEAKIFVRAGSGGNGSGHFRRERCVEFGGPDGGNGGKGGDVVILGDANLNTLISFRYQKHFHAQNGEGGSGQCKFGAAGNSITLRVPVGTEIYDSETDYLMAEVTEDKQEVILIEGGQGGIGNIFFKSSVNQAPRKAMPGFPGPEKWIRLVMKLLADVGLIGKPNAGKSSFLKMTTNSDAKVASYQFTTLCPNLGVIEVDKTLHSGFIVADLPGLIEGAAEGKGLGIEFLKHVEKCQVLAHIIDIYDKDVNQAMDDYEMIWNELVQYNELLSQKEEVIVLNKIDMCYDKDLIKLMKSEFEKKLNKKVFLISTKTGEGIKSLVYYLDEMMKKNRRTSDEQKAASRQPYRPQSKYKSRWED
jgi:GTP-binding protein